VLCVVSLGDTALVCVMCCFIRWYGTSVCATYHYVK